jgi:hypothetical protein
MIEIAKVELTDEELAEIDATGGLYVGHPVGTGFGFGGGHWGGGFGFGHFGGGFDGFGFGSPVVVEQLVPVATQTVVEQPVTGVQTTNCQTSVELALV